MTHARRLIIAGNWKMHKTSAETRALVKELTDAFQATAPSCEVVVSPPFVSLAAAVETARGTAVQVSAQNVFWEDKGAYTGEVSGPMIKEIGCSHVIIGHSERRQYFGETDDTVNKRITAALRHDLIPIFCLGETLEEREQNRTFEVIKRQLIGGLGDLKPPAADRFVVAYEPVWAIGTGKTATPDQAQEVHAYLRNEIAQVLGADFAGKVRILYGGSMKPDNASTLTNRPDIDGGLVGGASLKAADFLGIITASSR